MTKACMGGWCLKREHCQHYHSPQRYKPAERLCIRGADGIGEERPIELHRSVGAWEVKQMLADRENV